MLHGCSATRHLLQSTPAPDPSFNFFELQLQYTFTDQSSYLNSFLNVNQLRSGSATAVAIFLQVCASGSDGAATHGPLRQRHAR